MNRIPLFPRSAIILRRKFHTHVETRSIDGRESRPSINTVTATVFADEMPATRGQVEIDSALGGWVILAGDPVGTHNEESDSRRLRSFFREYSIPAKTPSADPPTHRPTARDAVQRLHVYLPKREPPLGCNRRPVRSTRRPRPGRRIHPRVHTSAVWASATILGISVGAAREGHIFDRKSPQAVGYCY